MGGPRVQPTGCGRETREYCPPPGRVQGRRVLPHQSRPAASAPGPPIAGMLWLLLACYGLQRTRSSTVQYGSKLSECLGLASARLIRCCMTAAGVTTVMFALGKPAIAPAAARLIMRLMAHVQPADQRRTRARKLRAQGSHCDQVWWRRRMCSTRTYAPPPAHTKT